MLAGILVGLGIALVSVSLGLYVWFYGYFQKLGKPDAMYVADPVAEKKMRWRAIFIQCCLLPLAWVAGYSTVTMQGNCLFEKVVEGSSTMLHDGKVSYNKEHLAIEHPGVKHKIQVWPAADETPGSSFDKPIVVAIILIDPQGKIVMNEQMKCKSEGIAAFSFTPDQVGDYDFRVTTSTADVPKLHVYVTDPKKMSGHRLPGY